MDEFDNEYLKDVLDENVEITSEIYDSISPILNKQEEIRQIVAGISDYNFSVPQSITNKFKEIADDNRLADAIVESSRITQTWTDLHPVFQSYQFESPAIKICEEWSNIARNLASGLTAFVTSPVMQEIQTITSSLGKWLQTVDFSPLVSILESINNIGFNYDYEEVNEIYLKAMFDARWFPYAGWLADFRLADEMVEILNTSRASKNRIKRIDKLIFSYYNKEEMNDMKRKWRKRNLPSYMTRILIQSVQAYNRREYALTVSALSTLWEGIIQEKVNDDSYRISRKTRENLKKLIGENKFDDIFASFCEEFIFYNCTAVEEVKPDVPGRHGIAHCWYNTYPSRKMALNAILFTDFLLELKPLEKTEDENNGQT